MVIVQLIIMGIGFSFNLYRRTIQQSFPGELFRLFISSNSASGAGGGGAILGDSETQVENTIVAHSTSGGNCDEASPHLSNDFNNIDSGATCHFSSSYGSMSNTNPMLGALKENCGFTEIMLLLNGSPAEDVMKGVHPEG